MAAIPFNIALGRIVELYNRVKSGDPANSALVIVALQATGLESQATLQDYDTLADLLAAANNEATNAGYARKVLVAADLAALPAPNDTDNRREVDLPDQTFASIAAAGGAWGMLLVCYDSDTSGGTDANIVPLTMHDFAVTPDGNNIAAHWHANGFHRAQAA